MLRMVRRELGQPDSREATLRRNCPILRRKLKRNDKYIGAESAASTPIICHVIPNPYLSAMRPPIGNPTAAPNLAQVLWNESSVARCASSICSLYQLRPTGIATPEHAVEQRNSISTT